MFIPTEENLLKRGRSYDQLMRWRYLYYVLGISQVSDREYDVEEGRHINQWSGSPLATDVGSSAVEDYPAYIKEGRRPRPREREERDAKFRLDAIITPDTIGE